MRFQKFGMVGLVALLAARAFVGCSSDAGEPGYDAGTLPEAASGEDAGENGDTGAIAVGDDAGGDATLGDDGGGSSDDGGGDTSLPEGTDASDAGHEADAGDAGHASDAGDAGRDAAASDAGHDVDASDAGHEVDASDAAAPPVDAGDASAAAVDASDAASSDDDASDSSAGAVDASDAAPACVSCGMTVSFLGNTAAFVTGGAGIALQSGTVPDGASVSITTQTYPQNSVTAGNAHLVYATDQNFTTQVDLPMTFDHTQGNNDQWYAIVPVQPANTTVYWYLRANGCDCSTVLYDNPGGLSSFTYTEQ